MAQIVQAIERYHAELQQSARVHPLCGAPSACVSRFHGGVGAECAKIDIERRRGPEERPGDAHRERRWWPTRASTKSPLPVRRRSARSSCERRPKILTAPGEHGKVNPQAVENIVHRRADIHFPKPRVLSISQATEMGTVYSIAEFQQLGDLCRRLNLKMHMDGARLANAVVSLDVAPKEVTWTSGVDVLCFGGSKNGLPLGEAVIFFKRRPLLNSNIVASKPGSWPPKMRFLAAPWVGLLKTGAWLANARHANQMAARLENKLQDIPGIEILCNRQSNSVFARFPPIVSQRLRERGWQFYEFIADGGARLMCSWDTKDEEIQAITDDVRELMKLEQH